MRDIDPSVVITPPDEPGGCPRAYETFKHKDDDCMKVVHTPCLLRGTADPGPEA